MTVTPVNTYFWNTTQSGFWSDASDWSPFGPPGKYDTVIVDPSVASGQIDVWDDVDASVANLTVGAHVDLQIGFPSSVDTTIYGGTIDGELEIRGDGTLTLSNKIANNGTIRADSAQSDANLILNGAHITGGLFEEVADGSVSVVAGISGATVFKNAVVNITEAEMNIGSNATLDLDSSQLNIEGGGLNFSGTNGTLMVVGTPHFTATVANLAGNSIDLTGVDFDAVHASLNGNTLSLVSARQDSGNIQLLGSYIANFTTAPAGPGYTGFVLSADSRGGTEVTYVAPPHAAV